MLLLLLALCFPYLSWQLPHNPSSSKSTRWTRGPNSLDLTRVQAKAPGLKARWAAPLQDTMQRLKYLVPIIVEGQTFNVELDTGSGDLWLIQNNFTCYKTYHYSDVKFSNPTTEDMCTFGATYTPGQGFQREPELTLLVEYGDRTRAVKGDMGYADVTIAGITVNQLIGAPINSTFHGYGNHIMSGVLGLGFSSQTRSYYKDNGSYHEYISLMTTIFETGRYGATFSLAISRDDSKNGAGGIFTINGLPDNTTAVNITTSEPTTAAFQIFTPREKDQQTFYAINIDNVALGNQTLAPNLLLFIDSGDYSLTLPSKTARAINAMWNPPIYSDGSTLACNATLTAPIGITIGGRTYYIQSQDLVAVDENGICYSLVWESDDGVTNVLGDPFLKNVLAVFDWTNSAMEFYPRQYYES